MSLRAGSGTSSTSGSRSLKLVINIQYAMNFWRLKHEGYLSERLDALAHGEEHDEPGDGEADEHPPVDAAELADGARRVQRLPVLRLRRVGALGHHRPVVVLGTRRPRQFRLIFIVEQKNRMGKKLI